MGTGQSKTFIAPTAIIHPTAKIGQGTKIWAFSQVAEHAKIGHSCVIGSGVYIDRYVEVGNRVRIHNRALLYHGVVIEDDVFIGPGVCFTNDPWPRSGSTRKMKSRRWFIGKGTAIGASSTILPDLNIDPYVMIGAGSVVTESIPNNSLVYGNPARFQGIYCSCGNVLKNPPRTLPRKIICAKCKTTIRLSEKHQHLKEKG